MAQAKASGSVRKLAWLAGGVTALGLILALGMILAPPNAQSVHFYRQEAIKLLLQFVLVTAAGSIIVALLAALRDQESKRQERIAALQALDQEIGATYRALKTVKRQLRSQLLSATRDAEGRISPPYRFPPAAFEKSMAELLAAQIKAEEVRAHIAVRVDLLSEEAIGLVTARLRYAARFFHDVHEDFERGLLVRRDDHYVAGNRCRNIDSLINSTGLPEDLHCRIKAKLRAYVERLSAGDFPFSERHKLLDELDALRSKYDKRRLRILADDSFGLASREIRAAISRELGREPKDDALLREYEADPDRAGTRPDQ